MASENDRQRRGGGLGGRRGSVRERRNGKVLGFVILRWRNLFDVIVE